MDNVRILHCADNIDNYNLCLTERVAGFTFIFRDDRGGEGDTIYFAVKVGKKILCGARATLGDITDSKPWEDAERYIQCFRLKNIEYCTPFDLKILSNIDKSSWFIKFAQRSKLIKDINAINLLNDTFNSRKIDSPYLFKKDEEYDSSLLNENNLTLEEIKEDSNDYMDELDSNEEKLDILGTFKTIRFKNETDSIRGLEPLVTEHFYSLFPFFKKDKSLLISDNRLFSTVGIKNENNENILGIKGIPDALLITYDKESPNTPLKINMIEYECYGESKYRTNQKFDYLNGTIIPQLIRFASTFSIVTDYKIRENTISEWIEKIITYIDSDENISKIVDVWMKDLYPNIKERALNSTLKKELKKAFESNIKILLIIDELTLEQKETITNVIHSFKLDNKNIQGRDNHIDFSAYVVKLEQRIGVIDKSADFALSFQE